MEAASREVKEETGVVIGTVYLSGIYYGTADCLLRIVFTSEVTQATVRASHRYADDILEADWFDTEDLPQPMPLLARRMIRAALAGETLAETVTDDSDVI